MTWISELDFPLSFSFGEIFIIAGPCQGPLLLISCEIDLQLIGGSVCLCVGIHDEEYSDFSRKLPQD